MVVTYPYRVKYNGKYYAPGAPVDVKESDQQNSKEPEKAPRRTEKK